MLRPRAKLPSLFSNPDHSAFSVAMTGVAFTLLTCLMITPQPPHGSSVYLPTVPHPVEMPAADCEDAITVAIMRDGKVFFRTDQIAPEMLTAKLNEALPQTSQRVVYFRADRRARYGEIKDALSAVRDAGIHQVAFLLDQRRNAQ